MDLIEQLERDEGIIPWCYQDSLGYWTAGVGFLMDRRRGGGLRPEEIRWILQNRLGLNRNALVGKWPHFAALDTVRQAAFENMAYEMGVDGLLAFTNTLRAAEQGDWQAVHSDVLDSAWARQVPPRAHRVAQQLLTGEWV
jgi:lysozyme